MKMQLECMSCSTVITVQNGALTPKCPSCSSTGWRLVALKAVKGWRLPWFQRKAAKRNAAYVEKRKAHRLAVPLKEAAGESIAELRAREEFDAEIAWRVEHPGEVYKPVKAAKPILMTDNAPHGWRPYGGHMADLCTNCGFQDLTLWEDPTGTNRIICDACNWDETQGEFCQEVRV